MTELETLQRAKMYMDKLANGINPLDDTEVPETDVINHVRLSRCFFYVSSVLGQVIEQGGVAGKKTAGKPKKAPFSLPYEKRTGFDYSETPIAVSEIAKRVNELIDTETTQKMTYSILASWLVEIGMLEELTSREGRTVKRPTEEGRKLGILLEERLGSQGPYEVVLYDLDAQRFLVDNLDSAYEAYKEKTSHQGQPWTPEQDEQLLSLFQKGVPEDEIALTLQRNKSSIRARLRKLGQLQG